jgi:hypothetical protein
MRRMYDNEQNADFRAEHNATRSKIMATPFTHLLVAVASLAPVYFVVAPFGNAWADDGCDYSLNSFNAPKGARKSSRDLAGTQGGSPGIAR